MVVCSLNHFRNALHGRVPLQDWPKWPVNGWGCKSKHFHMDIHVYLSRIVFSGEAKPDQETLKKLQLMHMQTVPFENLAIALGRAIQLDENHLWDKIVTRKRGGFCYEVNGLFASLLKEIGFEVTYLNARDFHEEDGSFGIDFDHLTLLVQIPKESTQWLVDVGWGDSFTQPLEIHNPDEQIQGLRGYWLEPFQEGFQLWQRGYDGKRERQYWFDLKAHQFPVEYEATCTYHQTSPLSPFTNKSIITRVTDHGRVSLDNNALTITEDGIRTKTLVTEDQRPLLLEKYFGVLLN
jgi:N-hydroxyarylamine O-acetyltransferase